MRNSHDDRNKLHYHKISEHHMDPRKGPVESYSAPNNTRPDASVAPTSIPREENKMSIDFLTRTAVTNGEPAKRPVRHDNVQDYHQVGGKAAVSLTLSMTPGTHATSRPSSSRRLARPWYTKEQKFFIVYSRVVRSLDWNQIEHDFKAAYRSRAVRGLNSVYYRMRKEWDIGKVKDECASRDKDKAIVLRQALRSPEELLRSIRCVHYQDLHETDVIATCHSDMSISMIHTYSRREA
jgi:hypothetical protein